MDIASKIGLLIKDKERVRLILLVADVLAFLLANGAVVWTVIALLGGSLTLYILSALALLATFLIYYGWIGEFDIFTNQSRGTEVITQKDSTEKGNAVEVTNATKQKTSNNGEQDQLKGLDILALVLLALRILVMSVFRYLFIVVLIWAVFVGAYVLILGHTGGTGPKLVFEVLTVFGVLSGLFDIYVKSEKESKEKALNGHMQEFIKIVSTNCSFLQFYSFVSNKNPDYATKLREYHDNFKGIFKVHLGAIPRTQNKDKVTVNFTIKTSGSGNFNFYPIELKGVGNPFEDYINLITGLCLRMEGLELRKQNGGNRELVELGQEIIKLLKLFDEFVLSKSNDIKTEGKGHLEEINKLMLKRIYFTQDIILDAGDIRPELLTDIKKDDKELAEELKKKMYNEGYVLSLWQDILIRHISKILILESEDALGIIRRIKNSG